VEAGEALEFMRRNREQLCSAYWSQLAPTENLRRYFWTGKGRHKLLPERENLERLFASQLRKSREEKLPPPEAYGSLDVTVKPPCPDFYKPEKYPVQGWLAAFDLDLKHSPTPPDEVLPRFLAAAEKLLDWGVEPEIRLSGGGLHLTFPFPPVEEPVAVNRELAEWLGRRFQVLFDTKIYSSHRMFRLSFSWHKSGVFSIPLDPWELEELKWVELRELASNLKEVKRRLKGYGLRWQPLGAAAEPEKLVKLLKLLKPLKLEPPVVVAVKKRVEKGWRAVETPDYGPVVYSAKLEGYGWLEALVKEGVLVRDGKMNMAWLVLAPAAARGLISVEDGESWLRKAAEALSADPEPYLEKFRKEVERRRGKSVGEPELALPTWRSLLTKTRKDGSPLESYYEVIRLPLLEVLMEKGLVRGLGGGERG